MFRTPPELSLADPIALLPSVCHLKIFFCCCFSNISCNGEMSLNVRCVWREERQGIGKAHDTSVLRLPILSSSGGPLRSPPSVPVQNITRKNKFFWRTNDPAESRERLSAGCDYEYGWWYYWSIQWTVQRSHGFEIKKKEGFREIRKAGTHSAGTSESKE